MNFNEKTINSNRIFEGNIIKVRVDDVLLVNGNKAKREVVEHSGAVAILPITDEGKIFLVKQFRKPIEKELIELPAGKLEKGEKPLECALRELEEEIGYKAEKITKLITIYTSPGFADEVIHIFIARELKKTKTNRDEDELIEIVETDINEALQMILNGKIMDSKTISGILTYINQNNPII